MWIIEKKYKSHENYQTIYSDYSEAKVRRQYLKYKANLVPTESLHLIHGGDILESHTASKGLEPT